MGAFMFIRNYNYNADTRPHQLIGAIAMTIVTIGIGITLFGADMGLTTLDSKPADGFGGFKIVNTSHNHHDQSN